MTKLEVAETYRQHLAAEGYLPKIDGDGDIVFRHEGRTHVIVLDQDDPTFFRIVFPNFWSIDDDAERARAMHAAHEATCNAKVAKVFLVDDNVWATIELFTSTPGEPMRVFARSMSALQAAVQIFAREMRGVADL